jgi:hypothetical protein
VFEDMNGGVGRNPSEIYEIVKVRFDAIDVRLEKIEELLKDNQTKIELHSTLLAKINGLDLNDLRKQVDNNRIVISKITTIGLVASVLIPVVTALIIKLLP